jgi:uncharacterized membrane protein YidH (DUF202 family)
MLSWLKTPLLKNTGSVARDHLASERTLLAWLRTGLGFVALGIGVERFSQLDIATSSATSTTGVPAKNKGTTKSKKLDDKTQQLVFTLLGTGSGAIVYGTTRYFSNMRLLERGLFKPAFHGAAGLSIAVAGLTGAAYWGIIRDAEAEKRR